eukprot:16436523-Heterocapsa_arctica.AAC.1
MSPGADVCQNPDEPVNAWRNLSPGSEHQAADRVVGAQLALDWPGSSPETPQYLASKAHLSPL